MKEFFEKHTEFVVKTLIWMAGVVLTVIFWVATMSNIPPRVERLEKEVSGLKEDLVKNNIKTDLVLQDTNYIKQMLINDHAKK